MRSSGAVALALVLVLGLAAANAAAATRYVTQAGNDSSDCTNSAAPCRTVNYAISQAVDGDTIQIGAGTFVEAVSTAKPLSFVGAGGPLSFAPTVIQGPAGGLGEFGKPAMELLGGGSVRALRAIGGTGGNGGPFGESGGAGIRYLSSSAAATSLSLEDVLAKGGSGGPGSTAQGSGGRGLDVRDDPGAVALTATGSKIAGGAGFGAGEGVTVDGSAASAVIADGRIANDDLTGAGVVVFSDARLTLDSVEVRTRGAAAALFDGLLTVDRSRLRGENSGLYVAPGTEESPEAVVTDSLIVSDGSDALDVEGEEKSTATARIFGSTLIGRGLAGLKAIREAGEGPATISLRNSIVRHLPPLDLIPSADLYAEGGTIEADFSSFSTRKEENGGTATAPGSGSNVAGDPGFLDPEHDVFILKNTSPLIDRGDPAIVQPGELDLLGAPRSLDGNRDCLAAPDMGAFEVAGQEASCPDPPPTVSAFGMTNRVFAPAGKQKVATASAVRRVKHGTRYTFTLSEPAGVVITIDRKTPGRRLGKSGAAPCVKVTAANRHKGRACTRFVTRTKLHARKGAGRQSLPWRGRIHGRPADAGKYRATIVATDASGQASQPRRLGFRIVTG
jgi:hypothetical protein